MTERSENGFPKARAADLVTERVGDELVVYDGLTSEAHCLKPLAAAVFAAADGRTSPADLAAIAGAALSEPIDVPQVERALAELEERGLVSGGGSHGLSRRQLINRGAALGGAAVAASLVTSVVTPAYGATSSGTYPDSLSGIGILVKCGTGSCTYYRMKWENGALNGPPGYCGTSFVVGNCLSLPSPPGTSESCLPGAAAKINYDSNGNAISVTISLPPAYQNCVIEYYVVKCGKVSGTSCPNNLTSPNTTPGDITLPISTFCG